MTRWLEFEALSRPWLRGVAQLAAWAAPFVILTRQHAVDRLSAAEARAPAVAGVLGLLAIVVLCVMVRRGRVLSRTVFLPALLPVLVGSVLAIASAAPALGETFASQFDAQLADAQLRRGLVVDGFRGGLLLLSAALTVLPWFGGPPAESRALPVAFGLRVSAPVLAIAVMLAWKDVHGDGQALMLLPALLGIIALAELASAPGRDSAIVLGAVLCAGLLAVLAAPIDQGSASGETIGAMAGGALKGFARYLPAPLLAFGLVFARRIDPLKTPSALLGALLPTLLVFALGLALVGRAHVWMRAPAARWVRELPQGFQPFSGEGSAPSEERIARVLLIGERSLWRGGQELGPTADLGAATGCDRVVQRLGLTRGEPLVFAADRRVSLAQLDCLLGAVTRSARARRDLDAKALKALCTARELRLDAAPAGIASSTIELFGEGCPSKKHGLAVIGPDWESSTAGDQLVPRAKRDSPCPIRGIPSGGGPSYEPMPLALTRRGADPAGHQLLACGFAPSVPPEQAPPPAPAPEPPGPFERLVVDARILSGTPNPTADEAFEDAVRRCHPKLTTWPKQSVQAWVGVHGADPEPQVWHVAQGLDDDAAARCIRGWAREFSGKLRSTAAGDARPVFFEYSLWPQKLALRLSTEGVKGNPWYPQVVEDRLPPMRACYETALRANPKLEGELMFVLQLNSKHRVLSAGSTQPPAMSRVAYCIAPLLQGLDTNPFPWMGDPRSASFKVEMQWVGD